MSALSFRIICLAALGVMPLPALAQVDTAPNQQLMQFAANNAEFDKVIETRAKVLFPQQFPECTSSLQVVRQLPQAYSDLTFPASTSVRFPAPSNGLWIEHVKVRACNKITQINILATGRKKGDPLLLALLPGETLSDPATQRDAERVGATAITKADAGNCSDTPQAVNTRLLGYKQPGEKTGKKDAGLGWFEEWTYRFCQQSVMVQMVFIPKENGGHEVRARPVTPTEAPKTPAAKPVVSD